MTEPSQLPGLIGLLVTAAQRLGVRMILGAPDERTLNRLSWSAVLAAARDVVGGDDPVAVEAFARAVDELFIPHELLERDLHDSSGSVPELFQAMLRDQLSPLFDKVSGEQPVAASFGVAGTADDLAHAILRELAKAVAFDAPAGALVLHRFASEFHARANGPRQPTLEARYLLCRSLDGVSDLISRELTSLPVARPLLFENDVMLYWREILRLNGDTFRSEELHGGAFASEKDYLREHPDARKLVDDRDLPYYESLRRAREADMTEWIAEKDGLTAALWREGAEPSELAIALGAYGACGDSEEGLNYHEWFHLRPVWFLMVALTVRGDESLVLTEVDGAGWNASPREWAGTPPSGTVRQSLPRIAVQAGEAVVIPVATLLPRLPLPTEHRFQFSYEYVDNQGRSEMSSLLSLSNRGVLDAWGPVRFVESVSVRGRSQPLSIRQFDPAAVYAMDRSWTIGSCPHAFLIKKGTAVYLGPVFSLEAVYQTVRFTFAEEGWLVLAELEDEVTELRTLTVNGLPVEHPTELRRGEIAVARVERGADVEVVGRYFLSSPVSVGTARRNAVVRDYLCTVSAGSFLTELGWRAAIRRRVSETAHQLAME